MASNAVEDYIKRVYEIQAEAGKVSTTSLAQRMAVSPASATGMIKRLAEMGLITHEPYQGVRLTPAGEKIAMSVLRRHRVLELFLHRILDMPWDEVHDEAEQLEHAISENVIDRMDQVMGNPDADPHGALIPSAAGDIPKRDTMPLANVEPGQSIRILQVSDRDCEMLRYLGERGLYPGTDLAVIAKEPFDGPLTIRNEKGQHVLGRGVANEIHVAITSEKDDQ